MHAVSEPKVAVLGAGEVAATFSYGLLLSGLETELLIVDRERDHAEELALELQQALLFSSPRKIHAGTIAEAAAADLIVICGGQQRNLSTAEYQQENLHLIQALAAEISGTNSSAIILVGAPPLDLLTFAAWRLSGLPREQVFGSGTIETSATLRYLLGKHFRVDPASVHAYVLGGDGGEVPIWSSASIAGMSVKDACKAHGCPDALLQSLFRDVQARVSPPHLGQIGHLSAGAGLLRLATAVLRNENHIFTVSTVLRNEYGIRNAAFSVPAVIGRNGIDRILHVELGDEEVAELLACGRRNEEAIKNAHLPEYHGATVNEVC